jgi:hypothetical protein
VARNWSELLGAGEKIAPTRKQMIWQRISTLPIMASFRPLMFSMIAPAIFSINYQLISINELQSINKQK